MLKFKHLLKYFILVTLVALLAGCSEETEKKEVIRPVRFSEVSVTGGEQTRVFTGTSEAGIATNLSFKVSGTIQEIRIKVGDKVTKGDVLAVMDSKDYNLQVQEAEAALMQSESQALNAKNSYERTRQLYEKRSASRSDLDAARSGFETADAVVERSRNSLELFKRQLSYTTLKAPTSGTIAAKNIEVNENAQAGQAIAILNVGKDMEVALGLPENVINYISAGMKVKLQFPAIGNTSFSGIVNSVSPSVNPNSATYPVRVKIVNPGSRIKSGMAANVTFRFGSDSIEELLVVPAKAVGEDSKGRFVFTLQQDGQNYIAAKTYVTIGKLTSDGFEILGGVTLGQKVATAGLHTLADGQKVKLN